MEAFSSRRLKAAGTLARVLWGEVLLDRAVLTGARPRLLGQLLNELALDTGSADALARACLDRARACGLWETARDFDPRAVPDPLGPGWFAALERAASSSSLAREPGFTRWMAWRRP